MKGLGLVLALALGAPEPGPLEEGRSLAEAGRWEEAAAVLTPAVAPEAAPAGALALLTRVVLEAGDLRRARLLAERGLLRFPNDLRFRRLDLAVLVARRDWQEAAAAARSVLVRDPSDALAWRQLAAAEIERRGDGTADARAALEAAWLLRPDDPELLLLHLRAQLEAGHAEVAAGLAREALERSDLASRPDLVELGVRAAEAAGDPGLAERWLARIPPGDRSTRLTLLEARIALASEDPARAEASLGRLVARGDASPAVLVRAGELAEARGDLGRAEALYAQAAEGEGEASRVAALTLARFLAKIGNAGRAREILETYLAERPGDAYARQLLRVVSD